MALRTEQTTMGRATDPKEQRRSAKRGRGRSKKLAAGQGTPDREHRRGDDNWTLVLSAHRRSGTQTTMGLRELGRKGRAKGGDGGTFIAGIWRTYCGRINTRMLGSDPARRRGEKGGWKSVLGSPI